MAKFTPEYYQRLYQQLGRLIETTPDMSTYERLNEPAAHQWIGRAHALVSAADVQADPHLFTLCTGTRLYTNQWETALAEIRSIIYRALGHCELNAPPAAAGSFVPVGNSFDAFAAISKLLQSAAKDVLIVDPYLDETALTEFGLAVPTGVLLRLLADESAHKATLIPASAKWVAQYGSARPLRVRLAPPKALHDRAIFVDQTKAWTLTQSLKDFAKRSPAEIVRADETGALKIDAYEAIWSLSQSILKE